MATREFDPLPGSETAAMNGVLLLIGFAAAAVGMAATTFMRKWQDFDHVTVVLTPLFLFSGTFFPISVYPEWLRLVEITPLSRGVHMLAASPPAMSDRWSSATWFTSACWVCSAWWP